MKLPILAKLRNFQMNLKYILIVVLLTFLGGSGILIAQYWWQDKVSDDQLLAKFLIENKIGSDKVGFESFKIIREDLNGDGENEVIIGFDYFKWGGWIGIIKKENERYLLSEWKELIPGVVDIEVINFPDERSQSLIVKEEASPEPDYGMKKCSYI